jgi:hypothetical protein
MTCWALAFVCTFDNYADAYPLGAHASPGLEGPTGNPGEMTRRAVRFLALDHGHEFPGVNVASNGALVLVSEVEPQNLRFLLRAGKARMHGQDHCSMPIDPRAAYRVALDWLPERCPGVDLSALREALGETSASAEEFRDRLTPEELAEEGAILDASLATIGIRRLPGGRVN